MCSCPKPTVKEEAPRILQEAESGMWKAEKALAEAKAQQYLDEYAN